MPDAVLTRTFALPSGERVRLRLAVLRDREAVQELLRRRGVEAGDLEVRRLLAADPRRRMVVLAFLPDGRTDCLVGLGAIDLERGADPDTLVVDADRADGLGELLGEVLRHRAESHARRAA